MKVNYILDDAKKVVYANMSRLSRKEMKLVQSYLDKGYKLIQDIDKN